MTDEGVMLLHTIGRMGKPSSTDAFTRKYIFPGGYIPALSETLAASEKVKLIASDVENLGYIMPRHCANGTPASAPSARM